MKDGKLYWEHNYYNEGSYRVTSTETIPAGDMCCPPKSE
jgi:hypothetical protein